MSDFRLTPTGNPLTEEQIEEWRRFLLNEVGVRFGFASPIGANVLCDMARVAAQANAIQPEARASEPQAGTFREDAVDARRYRWLRSEEVSTDPRYYQFWEEFTAKLCREEKMDAAIDAAMRCEPQVERK